MKRLIKFVLGFALGAGAAVLLTPKSGRALREQLRGGAAARLLPAAPDLYSQPEGEREWQAGGAGRVVAEAPASEPVVEESVAEVAPEPAAEEPVAEERPVAEAPAEEAPVEDAVSPGPVFEEEPPGAELHVSLVAEAPVVDAAEDLRSSIEATRAAVEEDVAEPFAPEATAAAGEPAEGETPDAESPAEPVADETAVAETPEEAFVEELSAEAEAPAGEAPVAVEASAEPAAEEPVVEEPTGQESAAPVLEAMVTGSSEEEAAPEQAEPEDQPAAEGAIDQAEMRRRIEETRARLKAKAFDAMTSGESALLSRDSGQKPVPRGENVDLEPEIDETIDESLSQDDS